MTGCTTHQCDPLTVTETVGSWRVVGDCSMQPDCELVWTSSATDATWLPFPGQQTYNLEFPQTPALPAGRAPDFSRALPYAWVTDSDAGPNVAGATSVIASGQLAEFTAISSTGVSVLNAGCQGYYLLVQVTVPVM
jgi:hypothetical protein